MTSPKRNTKTGLTDKEFSSYFASPKSVSKYTLEEGVKRAKLRDTAITPLLQAGMDYATAASLADKIVLESLGN